MLLLPSLVKKKKERKKEKKRKKGKKERGRGLVILGNSSTIQIVKEEGQNSSIM
jgi:hypothetical protein